MSVHVVPIKDERPHIPSLNCWCKPKVLWKDPDTGQIYSSPMVVHNASDCREVVEWATNESYGGWEVREVDSA